MVEQYGCDKPIKYIHGLGHPYAMLPDEIATPNVSGMKSWVSGTKRWIFMVRDPRDVIVSNYFERTKRSHLWKDEFKYRGSLKDYLREERGSYVTLLAYMQR